MGFKNQDILLKANASVSEGDNEGFLAFCTEDVIWEFVGDQVIKGKQAVREYMNATYLVPPVFDVQTVISDDDYVSVIGKITLTDADKKQSHFDYCDVWRFRDGLMTELKAFVVETKAK